MLRKLMPSGTSNERRKFACRFLTQGGSGVGEPETKRMGRFLLSIASFHNKVHLVQAVSDG